MKATITSIFDTLSAYASLRGSAIPPLPAGAFRTISGDVEQMKILAGMRCVERFRASGHRAMGTFVYEGRTFVGLLGFDFEPEVADLESAEVGAGAGAVVCAELRAEPKASAPTVLNVVGAASSADRGYEGHSFEDIQSLFPPIQLLEVTRSSLSGSLWPLLLKVAVGEAAQGGSWVGPALQIAMSELAELQAAEFPYSPLCRALFDLDPRSLFMALYRCIEATYARDACEKLASDLGLKMPWYELAVQLDQSLGWRAPEAASIKRHPVDRCGARPCCSL